MRRTFFFIVAVCLATSSFASIPRASALDLSSPRFDPLPETRIRVSADLAPFERPAGSELTRALRQGYEQASTTNESGLARFLSVDPGKDWDMHQPQSWNMYAYVRNNPVNATDPTGRQIYVQSHAVIDETKVTREQDHTSIRIEPVDQKRYANDADFQQFKNAETGRSYMTLGAGMSLGGNLVSNPNRELDVKLEIKTEVVKVDLKGQDENKVIAALRTADKNYGDSLSYRPFPAPAQTMQAFGRTVTLFPATYNSNSYTAGLLRAVGLTPPPLTRNVPGYKHPIPTREFQ